MMTSTPKVVISTTLTDPGWGPTTVISSDVTAELAELRQQPGGTIAVAASGTLVRFLLAEGLLDELRLLVHPVVVGAGRHLFEGGGRVPLNLAEAGRMAMASWRSAIRAPTETGHGKVLDARNSRRADLVPEPHRKVTRLVADARVARAPRSCTITTALCAPPVPPRAAERSCRHDSDL